MANPFLGGNVQSAPSSMTDAYGDNTVYDGCPWTVAGLLATALIIIVLMKVAGFRAMVGIGRG